MKTGGKLRGQVSAEFMVAVAALLGIFLIFYTIYAGQNTNLFQVQDATGAMADVYATAAAINYVHLAGNGASYNFTVPNYENVTISSYSVDWNMAHGGAGAPLLNGNNLNTTISNASSVIVSNRNGAINIE